MRSSTRFIAAAGVRYGANMTGQNLALSREREREQPTAGLNNDF